MKVSREKATENRRRIVHAASRLFRERGIEGTGVDSISAAADLTHGAMYSQFGSKEAIAVEALRSALAGSRRVWLRQLEKKGRKTAQSYRAIFRHFIAMNPELAASSRHSALRFRGNRAVFAMPSRQNSKKP